MGVGAITLSCMFSISKRLINAELKVNIRSQRYAYHRELFKPLAPSTVQIIHSLYRVIIMSWMCIYIWILESISSFIRLIYTTFIHAYAWARVHRQQRVNYWKVSSYRIQFISRRPPNQHTDETHACILHMYITYALHSHTSFITNHTKEHLISRKEKLN